MVFASPNSVTVFDPDQVAPNAYAPPAVLTEMLLFNRPVGLGGKSPLEKPIWAANVMTLHHDQSIFTLEFAALSYLDPEKNRYRYRLLGLERDWNEVDSRQRLATYTNLSPRNYVFQLQGSNNDGVWNPKITTLAITVLPPWWATWWFVSIAGLTISAIVYAAHRSRIRGLQLAGIRLETQVAERTRELEIAKDAAERANKAKGSFLAHMSHELRTPLNSILGFSAIVRDAPELSEKHREDLATVCRSGEHLLGLIDAVLDTAKIEAGRATISHTSFDLDELVGECIIMMRLRASDKGLLLTLHSDPAVPRFVRSDAGKLRQVLLNLVGNAVKFTEAGGVTVRLNARRADARQDIRLILEVEDTGIGIAPEDQARIFDAFVQADQASSQKGTGLGLSITREFVQMMGGTIHLESSIGKGSLFRAELPVQQVEEAEAVAPADSRGQVSALAPGQPGYRILIVEDKKENWLLLQRLLVDAGFEVQVAENGVRGIELFRAWQPHLIWMDVRLPVMGGLEATRRIRALEGGQRVRIVALTASAFAQQREEVLAAGLDDFLRKPFRREDIFDCMSRHLGVQYVYKEGPRTRPAGPVAALRPEAISQLPEILRKELAEALVSLDAEPIREVIGRVSREDAQLGEVLSRLASRFAYTEILDALTNSDVRVSEEAP
jgi:signal transduction histidine kinase/CheY-like chemotaxis protein